MHWRAKFLRLLMVLSLIFTFSASPVLAATTGGGENKPLATTRSATHLPDTTRPFWPNGSRIAALDITQTGLTLNWSAATGNEGATSYKVYNGSTLLGTVSTTNFDVTGLTAGTRYNFYVQAKDAAGNWSTDGPAITVTTLKPATYDIAPTWTNGDA